MEFQYFLWRFLMTSFYAKCLRWLITLEKSPTISVISRIDPATQYSIFCLKCLSGTIDDEPVTTRILKDCLTLSIYQNGNYANLSRSMMGYRDACQCTDLPLKIIHSRNTLKSSSGWNLRMFHGDIYKITTNFCIIEIL